VKFLKYLFITVVVLVLAFLAVGFIHPEVEYGSEIVVNKSLEEAWAVSQDESKYHLWLEGFQSMELIDGEYGQEGSKYRIVVIPQEGQPEFVMVETLVSKADYHHVYMTFDSDMMDFEQRILFDETEDGVSIKTESKVIGKGAMMRSMFALMERLTGSFTKQEQKNLDALKKVVDENTTDYYPILEEMVEDVAEAEEVVEE
jgi:hypothetical protein